MTAEEERVAVVSGASRGIGLAVARELGGEGARVVLVARDPGRLTEEAERLAAEGIESDARACDLANRAASNALADSLRRDYPVIQALVNNAGIATLAPVSGMADEEWDRVMEINLTAALVLSRGLLAALVASGRGAIVNVSSVLGLATQAGVAPYAVSKAGLQHLTRTLAVELGPQGVRVNAVAPGYIRTDMFERSHPSARKEALARAHPLRRVGTPEEVASAVGFLCSERAGFINGAILPVDGGLTCELAVPGVLDKP